MLGGDLEHAEEAEGEEAVDGEDDGPRRSFTVRGQFKPFATKLQGGTDETKGQNGGYERTVTAIDGWRRIWRLSPSAEAEQTRLRRDMAAAAKGNEGGNGNPRLRGSLWLRL